MHSGVGGVSLNGVHFRFLTHLGCSEQNAIVLSRECLDQGRRRRKIEIYIYIGVIESLDHAQTSLLLGYNYKFPTSIPASKNYASPTPGCAFVVLF